jgi:hypothetical protein
MASDTPETTTAEKPASNKPTKPASKAAAEKPATMRVKMHTSTAGFQQIPDLDENGKPKYSPTTGKQLMKNGAEFVWNPGQEYEIPTECAERYIELGYASAVT